MIRPHVQQSTSQHIALYHPSRHTHRESRGSHIPIAYEFAPRQARRKNPLIVSIAPIFVSVTSVTRFWITGVPGKQRSLSFCRKTWQCAGDKYPRYAFTVFLSARCTWCHLHIQTASRTSTWNVEGRRELDSCANIRLMQLKESWMW